MTDRKAYTIEKNAMDAYVKRQVKKKMKIVGIVLLVFMAIIFLLTASSGFYKFIIPFLCVIFLIIGFLVYAMSLSQLPNIARQTEFYIDENDVTRLLNWHGLSFGNKFGMARNEARYGSKYGQVILLQDIDYTKITKDGIIIKSFDYNFLNDNGKVEIPKEVAGFNEIKAMIFAQPALYKLASTNGE